MKLTWEPAVVSIIFFIVRLGHTEPFGLQRNLMDASDSLMFRIRSICDVYNDLTRTQREVCHESSVQLIASVADGAEMARRECARQFANERWNCTVGSSRSLLGLMANIGNKEAAFYYTLVCAGIIHFMARDCMKGIIDECHCSKAKRPTDLSLTHKWGGCGDNVEYALAFSKKFLHNPTLNQLNETNRKQAAKLLMDAHNAEAGRQAILKHGRRVTCKCHGVTSQCSSKTCWYQLREFDDIGNYLKRKYVAAVKARAILRKKGKKAKWLLRFKSNAKSRNNELVYVRDSPNYCRPSLRHYSTGTVGRQCNATRTGDGSCQRMCCSGRYKNERKTITEKCRCKFFWCCDVICDYCDRVVDVHTCL